MTTDDMTDNPLGCLYELDARDRAIFGEQYCATATFEHGVWQTVARLSACSDGQPVEIDESRLPARFFRLRAQRHVSRVGRVRAAFTLTTGTGDDAGRLMMTLARAIASGMVGLDSSGQEAI